MAVSNYNNFEYFVVNILSVLRYAMEDLEAIGGLPTVLRTLLDAKLLHPDCLTGLSLSLLSFVNMRCLLTFGLVTGKTLKENLANVKPLEFTKQKVIYPVNNPIAPPMHRIFTFVIIYFRNTLTF